MRPAACLRLAVALAATGSVSVAVAAQTVHYESLTDRSVWSQSSNTGASWNNGVTDPRSNFNKLDRLNSATSFTYTRSVLLQPGTYVADVRFAKATSTAGAADISFKAIATSVLEVKALAAAQTPDEFLNTKAMLIALKAAATVTFFLENTDATVSKTDYLFDSFHIGRVERGPAVLVESMGRRWGHAWGAPHYCKEHPDPTAAFGFVERLNPNGSSNCGTGAANLWWFAWNSGDRSFLPGVHTFNLRIKKVVSTVGAHDFDLWVRTSRDGGNTWTDGPKVEWKATAHTVGQWVYSPNISFDVVSPTDLYQFRLERTSGSFKADYYFDTFEVRRGEYTPFGVSCMNSGQARMTGNVPQLGYDFDVELGPLGANTNPVTFILGASSPNLDLSIAGWNGCWMYASLDVLLGMTVAGGAATLSTPLPVLPPLIGIPFYTQSYQPTATGLATSNGVRGMIGN